MPYIAEAKQNILQKSSLTRKDKVILYWLGDSGFFLRYKKK